MVKCETRKEGGKRTVEQACACRWSRRVCMKGWFLNEDRRECDEEAPVHMSTFQLFIILRSAGSKLKSTSMFSSILSGFVDYFRHEPYDAVWHTEREFCGAQRV